MKKLRFTSGKYWRGFVERVHLNKRQIILSIGHVVVGGKQKEDDHIVCSFGEVKSLHKWLEKFIKDGD